MRRVRGNLCRTSKGRFTRCRGKTSAANGRRRTAAQKRRTAAKRCKRGVVKSGPRKGRCRKR